MKERVLAVVSEKTGYPVDMLDLDLDLEADLGVDTVKQAEVFAAVREAYGIPRDDNMRLRDFPTLAHVMQFVRDKRPDLAAPQAIVAAPVASPRRNQPLPTQSRKRSSRSSRKRPAIRRTCWTWTLIWKPISASTR